MSGAVKTQICDAISVLTAAEILDFNGHVSVLGEGGRFWINSAASNRAAMSGDQVCHVDADGNPLPGQARPPNEVALHAAIYMQCPQAKAIVHGHPKWTTLFTLTGNEIPVVMPQGCLVAGLPVYPESHSISTADRAEAVAEQLVSGPGILLAGHGSVFVAETLVEATALAIYAEMNAERAYLARALGHPNVIPMSQWAQYRENLSKPALFEKCWQFHLGERSKADVR